MNRLGSTLVVDASVAIKWLVPEPDSEVAAAVAEGRSLAAPDILLVECANILWRRVRRHELMQVDAVTGLADLGGSPIAFTSDGELAGEAQRLALDFDHPVYDCLYLALAVRLDAPVVTADRRFAALSARFPLLEGRIVGLDALR